MKSRLGLALATAVAFAAGAVSARDQIRIVGSSTVFPFATAVGGRFAEETGFATPIVEVTASGEGLKLFCAGVGPEHPDVSGVSRRMDKSEFATCQANGVTGIVEIKLGFDGIVIGNARAAPAFDLTLKDMYRALAKDVLTYGRVGPNRFVRWDEINAALPAQPIGIIGPPPSSGRRGTFRELVLQAGGKAAGLDTTGATVVEMRDDGAFVEVGENAELIVSMLEADPARLGLFAFSVLAQNAERLKGSTVEGVAPTFENIAAGDYPVSRSLFLYVKHAHIGVIPGLEEYLEEIMSDAASGENGYIVDTGLIPLPAAERETFVNAAKNFAVMTGEEF